MIRFAAPFALLGVIPVVALLFRGRRRGRDLVLPTLAGLALLLALAEPEVRRAADRENVIVLLDRSPSVALSVPARASDEALAALRKANADRSFGVVSFAALAEISVGLSEDPLPLPGVASAEDLGQATDLSAAIELALAALPKDGESHLVLLSDGRITEGLLEGVTAARAAGVPVSVLPLSGVGSLDARLLRLDVPVRIEVDRPFAIEIVVESDGAGPAELSLYRDGEPVAQETVALREGWTAFQIVDRVNGGGAAAYQALVKRPGDPVPQNDSLSAVAEIEGPPPLWIVAPEVPAALDAALRTAGRAYTVRASVPTLADLQRSRELLVTGISLATMTREDVRTLRSFVADLGGGLLIAEGETELRGVGSVPLEDLLPVTFTVPERAEQASLAVVYVLDRSGSMQERAEGAIKIDVLKEVAAASIGLLEPDTLVGILVFDREPVWVQAVAPVADGRSLYAALQSLRASGGTDLYRPVAAALDALRNVEARVKHILVLSDGKTAEEEHDWDGLLMRLADATDVHLSVIAVGPQPNRALLDRLASAGRGVLYVAEDFARLPQVSLEATRHILRGRFITGESTAVGPLASGDLAALPPLHGYALTYPRPTAEVLLAVGKDPVVARWRVGLGRVGVVNADLAGDWTREWLSWSRAPLLLDALLGTVDAETWAGEGLFPSIDVGRDRLAITVEARRNDRTFVDFLALQAVVLPRGEMTPLLQVGPGLYAADLPLPSQGAYVLSIEDLTNRRTTSLAFTVPYPDEFRHLGVDDETLRGIARATGGRVLIADAGLADLPPTGRGAVRALRDGLLLFGLALFLLELVRRKLPQRVGRSPTG
ncbi:MAG: VWA domain-containing protein [Candidatus Bipolaricaulota bacterium]